MKRPNRPDPQVLEAAGDRAREILQLGQTEPIQWRVGDRIDANRSSVFPLTVLIPSVGQYRAFYKVAHPPEREGDEVSVWETEQKEALIVGPGIEERLRPLAAEAGVSIAATLATDPDRLIHVTQAVPGRPLGRISQQLLTPRRKKRALAAVERAGTAAALIEACSPPGLELPPRTTGQLVINRRLERVRGSFSPTVLRQLADVMTQLQLQATEQANPVVYSHGDFNTKNVLVAEGRIGLIDFSWLPRLRHSVVAHFAVRVDYEPGVPRFWANQLVEALVDGYGDPVLTTRPGWIFLRLSKLLRLVRRGDRSSSARHRRLAKRARSEIEDVLSSFR